MLVDSSVGLLAFGSRLGLNGVWEGLTTSVGGTASCCLLVLTGVPSFWQAIWYSTILPVLLS